MRDFVAVGTLAPASVIVTVVALLIFFGWLHTPWSIILGVAVLCSGAGAIIGALFALPLYGLARWLWPRARLVAFATGPVAGVIAANGIVSVLWVAISDGSFGFFELTPFTGLGALGVGPPWIAYLAVRHAGRSAVWVVAATPVWLSIPAGFLVLLGVVP